MRPAITTGSSSSSTTAARTARGTCSSALERRRRARARRSAVAQFRSPKRADGRARGRARPRRHHDGRRPAASAGAAAAAHAQVARGFPDRPRRAARSAERLVVQAHDVEALLPAVRVHERRRDRAGLGGLLFARSAGRRRGAQVRGGGPVLARARALGGVCDDERAVRVRCSAMPARASTTCARC